MSDKASLQPGLGKHGAKLLPAVEVDSFNLELRNGEGFIGDLASKSAFSEFLESWRERVRKVGQDPLGDTEEPSRKTLEKILVEGEPEAAGIVQGAIEDFAEQFAAVLARFLRTKEWKGTERIAVGGGMAGSRIGELAIGRAAVLLKADEIAVDLRPIRQPPNEAGLLGAVQLAPPWIFAGHDSILAVDIGGTNIRAGIILLNLKKEPDLSAAEVWETEIWRHRDDSPTREEAVDRLVEMLKELIGASASEGHKLAPFIGIGCPGIINEDGTIERGAQNLPGNWHSSRFNLPSLIVEAIPKIGDYETVTLMHNDAVVQGLSQVPFMQDVRSWAAVTIGTGLGNARFTNRKEPEKPERKKRS